MNTVIKNISYSLTVLAAVWVVGTASASASGVVTLNFDDGNPSQYENVVPILKAEGQTATFYINSGWLGLSEWYMSWDDLLDLRKSGFEIAGHGLLHVELPTLTNILKQIEINLDYLNFVRHGITPTDFAVPFGAYDNPTTALVAARYNSLRGFKNQGLNVWPYNKYLLYVRYVTNQTSAEQAKAWVDEAIAQDAWLILVFHEILPVVDPTDEYSWEISKFQTLVEHLGEKGVKTKTVAQVLGGYTNLITNPSFESGLTGWTTDNAAHVTTVANGRGSFPTPLQTLSMAGSPQAAHLFGAKIPVSFGSTYGFRAYTDSRNLIAGEVGFFIDEYNEAGNWISGKWLGGFTNVNVIDKAFAYTPTSSSVKTAAVQVYMTAGAAGTTYIDNIEFFAKLQASGSDTSAPYSDPAYPFPSPWSEPYHR